MRATTYGEVEVEQLHKSPAQAETVCIDVDLSRIAATCTGIHVATVDCVREDGKRARFFVRLMEKNGRVRAELTALGPNRERDVFRSACGMFRGDLYDHR